MSTSLWCLGLKGYSIVVRHCNPFVTECRLLVSRVELSTDNLFQRLTPISGKPLHQSDGRGGHNNSLPILRLPSLALMCQKLYNSSSHTLVTRGSYCCNGLDQETIRTTLLINCNGDWSTQASIYQQWWDTACMCVYVCWLILWEWTLITYKALAYSNKVTYLREINLDTIN